MKKLYFFFAAAACLALGSCQKAEETMSEVIERGLAVARSQAVMLAQQLQTEEGAFPRYFQNGRLETCDYTWWCSGFFPGELWMLSDYFQDTQLREYAEYFTAQIEPIKKVTEHHDVGFMLFSSFGKGYKITGNPHYLDVVTEGTHSLLTRFNPDLGVIMSWNPTHGWKYPVIIDNMMNLEMLCYVSKQTGDDSIIEAAKSHADKTLQNHFREDYSTYHVVSYDPETLGIQIKQTFQGYSDGSAWSRGQSWGLYGFTMMYRETGEQRYLEQARHIAHFLVEHPRLPEDGIPYWDYDDPAIPDAPRDASAAAIMASALVELSQLDETEDAALWLETAQKQLRSLSSPEYLASEGEQGGFLIKHCSGNVPGMSEVDASLSYADYYYVEALLRLKKVISL